MIRSLLASDIPQFIELMRAFAEFDGSTNELEISEEAISANWLSHNPKIHTLLKIVDDKPIGLINYFFTFSSFQMKSCIWVEDAFILEPFRGKGFGIELFAAIKKVAIEKQCARVEWLVRKDNTGGRRFYDRLGARVDEETIYVKWRVES